MNLVKKSAEVETLLKEKELHHHRRRRRKNERNKNFYEWICVNNLLINETIN